MTGLFSQTWVWLSGSLLAIFAFIRGLYVFSLRLRGNHATRLLELLRERGHMFITKEELSGAILPSEFTAFCWLDGLGFCFSINERILQAGAEGTESIAMVWLSRFGVRRFKRMISIPSTQNTHINVHILQPWDSQKIGTIKIPDQLEKLYLDDDIYSEIDNEVRAVVEGKKPKTGLLFYGPPGNGKSFTIRHFALKYHLPINIVALTQELDNHSLIRMFSRMQKSIVLFEDFDAYFNKRICQIQKAQFTFDVILNVIDGVFSSPEGIIFAMTANSIDKVDVALKSRPSRFRIVRKLDNPTLMVRQNLFTELTHSNQQGFALADLTNGCTLDMCLFVKNRILEGVSCDAAIRELDEHFPRDEEKRPLFMRTIKEEKGTPVTPNVGV